MLMQEAASREIFVEPRSLAIAKRGVCTFVQKAMKLQNAGANLALIVNNGMNDLCCCFVLLFCVAVLFCLSYVCSVFDRFDVSVNEMTDMPAGKEKTDQLHMPVGLSTENDGKEVMFSPSPTTHYSLNVSDLFLIPYFSFVLPSSFFLLSFYFFFVALLTHLAASNHNEIWAIVSESGIPAAAPAVVAAPVTPTPAAPAGKIGKGGKNTRAAANAAKSKLTPVAPVTPVVSSEIVYESGGMTVACGKVQNLVEDIVDRFPHTVPPLSSRQVLSSVPPDTVRTFLHSCTF